jgi:hypothetical protein
MVEYAEKRLPEFRSAYDKLTRCAKELTLVYEDIYASVVRDPKRLVLQFIFVINSLFLFFCRLYRTLLMRLKHCYSVLKKLFFFMLVRRKI